MAFGERELRRGDGGPEVVELQVRLAGFRGTVPDGDFGPGTELQVARFQQDFMERDRASGLADRETLQATARLAERFPLDFEAIKCPCGQCDGFGQGRFEGNYRSGKPEIEAYHLYEYPGIHRMLLWAVRGIMFYIPEHRFVINSGYRCAENNRLKGRSSTNHHGKAIDLDVPLARGEDKRDDMRRCEEIRGRIVETANAQVGWTAANRKSLEPPNIAPTWVHYDVRNYDRRYLADGFFCATPEQLDQTPLA